MSVRLSVRFRRKAIFSAPNRERLLIFSVHLPLIYEHLFYKYFVRRSVGQATNGQNVKTPFQLSVVYT